MFSRKLIPIGLIFLFTLSLLSFTSCGGRKKGYKPASTKVKSGSGMGNRGHKNKHVWGK
ncbi:MAG: hypothetical protein JKY48_20355 [Flavobacteriales bacterium]|nr:hypothetical protein [Flavobacteriales bacterium]